MYDINKRKQFKTVGELKEILNDIPDDTQVLICGEDYGWLHIEQDNSVVCLDNEDLECCYEDAKDLEECCEEKEREDA